MTQHTPGPWTASSTARKVDSSLYRAGITANNHGVSPAAAFAQTEEQVFANACLIAAAPELLEALKLALLAMETMNGENTDPGQMLIMRHAIAKAEGRTK